MQISAPRSLWLDAEMRRVERNKQKRDQRRAQQGAADGA
jgi:hypothetical protein